MTSAPPRLPALAARLFAPAPVVRWSGRAVAVGAAAVAAGTVVSLLRHPGTVALDTVYAEDGSVFLADAVDGSPIGAVTSSYAGYYHLVPRLLAALASAFPVSAAAAVLAVSAALVTALLAVLVYVVSAGHLASPVARVLVAAPVVVAPLAQDEVPNSIANLHWPLLYTVFWLLIWTPAGRAGRVLAPVVVAATALSDILVLVFLPLAAVRLFVRRDRYSAVLAGVLAVGVAVQLSGLATGSSAREDISLDPVQPITGYVLRAVPAGLVGERWLPEAGSDPLRLALAALAWLLLAAAALVAVRRVTAPRWPLAAATIVHSVGLYALPVILTGIAPPRYALAPTLLLLVALVAALHPGTTERSGVPLAVLAVGYAVVCALNLQVDTARDDGPRWSDELDNARTECLTTAPGSVAVPITPADADWTAELRCRHLDNQPQALPHVTEPNTSETDSKTLIIIRFATPV